MVASWIQDLKLPEQRQEISKRSWKDWQRQQRQILLQLLTLPSMPRVAPAKFTPSTWRSCMLLSKRLAWFTASLDFISEILQPFDIIWPCKNLWDLSFQSWDVKGQVSIWTTGRVKYPKKHVDRRRTTLWKGFHRSTKNWLIKVGKGLFARGVQQRSTALFCKLGTLAWTAGLKVFLLRLARESIKLHRLNNLHIIIICYIFCRSKQQKKI